MLKLYFVSNHNNILPHLTPIHLIIILVSCGTCLDFYYITMNKPFRSHLFCIFRHTIFITATPDNSTKEVLNVLEEYLFYITKNLQLLENTELVSLGTMSFCG